MKRPAIFNILLIAWVQAYLLGPELVKLPMLGFHFIEHRQNDQDLGLADFLELHYSDARHHGDDHEGHENLPFHHHHGAAVDHQVAKVWNSEPLRPVGFPALSAWQTVALPIDRDPLAGHHPELLRPPRTVA